MNCGVGGWCDSGQCYCAPGLTGLRCQEKCPAQTWGAQSRFSLINKLDLIFMKIAYYDENSVKIL